MDTSIQYGIRTRACGWPNRDQLYSATLSMALSAGTRIGPYEILSVAGGGGMGEVYKARDTRLDRLVAIKVLAPALAGDPQFRERFDREARTISQLQHPHICTLFDVGRQDAPTGSGQALEYLVLEFLEGETLADRLAKGPIPLDQALTMAIDIADALDTAHRAGIVHRDLKPGNVMLVKTGGSRAAPNHVKLLDFGLARTTTPAIAGTGVSAAVTTPAAMTAQGTIVGTFQYMAPEQIEGEQADARTDIFAFGCVLYEMLTGRKAFTGKSHAALISAIMQTDPLASATAGAVTPPALDRIIRRCLEKDPDARWQDVRDLKEELRWVAGGGAAAQAPAPAAVVRRGGRVAWMAAGVLALGLAASAPIIFNHLREKPTGRDLVEFAVPEPLTGRFGGAIEAPFPTLSPDGRRLVFQAIKSGNVNQLWVRPLGSLEAQPLPGTDNATAPFWSPDSRTIGFFASSKLMTIDADGGPVATVCDAPGTNGVRGGTWNRDGVILFSQSGGIFRVSANSGEPTRLTSAGLSQKGISPRYPSFLPDGRHFVYVAYRPGKIMLASLDSSDTTTLGPSDSRAQYAAPGYLLFVRQGTLVAQPFDADRLRFTGDSVPIAERVRVNPQGGAAFSASETGALVYRTGSLSTPTLLRWFDRAGKPLGPVGQSGMFRNPVLSHDGTRLAVEKIDPGSRTSDVWLLDLAHGEESRFTFDAGNDIYPVWSPDGTRIMFGSDREGGVSNLYQKLSNNSGADEMVLKDGTENAPYDWSQDGRHVLYRTPNDSAVYNVAVLPLSGDRKPRLFQPTTFNQVQGQVSPNGRWMAYASNESGRFEIYVQSFPTPGSKSQISKDGGVSPKWRADGKEIFFYSADERIMAVPVKGDAALEFGTATPLFAARLLGGGSVTLGLKQQYDVSRDGQRFLLNVPIEGDVPAPMTVVVNWTAALKQ